MIIIPAIDIQDGNVVRLAQGKFDEVTQYGTDPVSMANQWVRQGAERIHIVDLDGAKTGVIKNLKTIIDVANSITIPVEVGGGVRKIEDIEKLIMCDIDYVILGTRVVQDKQFLKHVIENFDEKIIVSLDCSNGKVAERGWTEVTDIDAVDFAKELEQTGVQCLVYTDIARDGMLTGPNFEGLEAMLDAVNIPIIASGGISKIDDIKKLLELESKGILGAITGRAIYEGKLNLEEAIFLCETSK